MMSLVTTLRRVLANLQEGRPAEAVRTDAPVAADATFWQRLQAQDRTDAWLQTLLPALPVRLHLALAQCAHRHGDAAAITTLPGLLQQIERRRDGLLAELGRAGLPATAPEQARLGDLTELLALLPQLGDHGAVDGLPPHPS